MNLGILDQPGLRSQRFFFFKGKGVAEVAQVLGALVALPEGQSLVHRTHIKWLTTSVPHTYCINIQTHTRK